MKIYETHAHLDFDKYDKNRETMLQKAFKMGVTYINNIGYDDKSIIGSFALADKYPQIYAAAGFHPHDATKYDEELVRKYAKHSKCIAIGEIGLDYYRKLSPKKIQKEVFIQQIKIALEYNLPIVVHDRDAHEDTLEILEKFMPKKVVFHCFAGDEVMAQRVLANGWKMSFTGNITYKNSNLHGVIRNCPNDSFFVETDSPYLAPVPFRGKLNDPTKLRYIIEKIADIKRISPNKVAEYAYENSINFFLPKK
jgi:TatD DNase family protein